MAAVTAVLEMVGASFVLVTVSTYESEAVAPAPSVQVTVMVCVPTSAFNGVPLMTPEATESVVGAPAKVYAIVSPTSTSAHIADTSREYAASSATEASEIGFASVGASFVLATVMLNESVTDAVPSLNVITTAWLPTSALVGVPVRTPVEAVKVSQLGTVVPAAVNVSPASTSDAVDVYV